MQFEVVAEDGRSAKVDAADWMMALVRGVDRLGDRVTGFSCSTQPDGEVHVEDHGTGRNWVVRPLGESTRELTRSMTPSPQVFQETGGPSERRLMTPRRRLWRTMPARPLWEPDAAPRIAPSQNPRSSAPPNLSETLFEYSIEIGKTSTLEDACTRTLQRVMALVLAEGGSILRGGEEDNQLVFVAVRGGAGDLLLGQTVPWGKGIAGAACVGGVPIVVRDAQSDPRHDGSFDAKSGFVTKGLMAVPIRTASGFYGVVELVNPDDPSGFQPWHVDVVESLARALADRLSGRS